MVAVSWAWYNGSYTMAVKPIKFLELHYAMIQFLIPACTLYSKYISCRRITVKYSKSFVEKYAK